MEDVEKKEKENLKRKEDQERKKREKKQLLEEKLQKRKSKKAVKFATKSDKPNEPTEESSKNDDLVVLVVQELYPNENQKKMFTSQSNRWLMLYSMILREAPVVAVRRIYYFR